ncbi:unnamed protein product [Durusdinium trenchii]|uniref:Uncharacterized protein n=2 Tax=Durusdinium trenchii TaxID=1381693 RepID=A0ABP0MCB8_9DINO
MALYAVVGLIGMLVAPEQAFYALGLKEFRWMFQRLYPEAAHWNGNPCPDTDPGAAKLLLSGPGALSKLGEKELRVRWHGSDSFLSLDKDGWAVPGPASGAVQLLLQPIYAKGLQVPDTYTIQVKSTDGKWDSCWLACTAVSHLRFGGWLRAVRAEEDACPFKFLQDSSCNLGTCKVLSSFSTPPQQAPFLGKDVGCIPAGFYWVQQRHAGRTYVGQAPDAEADLLEFLEF